MSQAAPDERERLRTIAAFLLAFETPGFEIGTWTPARPGPDGVLVVGCFTLSEVGEAFLGAARSNGWVDPSIDWPTWSATGAARRLRYDPSLVAGATTSDLARWWRPRTWPR